MICHEKIRKQVFDHADQHVELLRGGLEASFKDHDTFQDWVGERLGLLGASLERFTLSAPMLKGQPAFRECLESEPDVVQFGTNVAGEFPGRTDATTLLFAHADKAPANYRHVSDGHGGEFDDIKLAGSGIADDVSGVTATIGAMETLVHGGWEPATSVVIASVLGKQLGVAGTYGLMQRYGPADAAVYAHPAESGRGLTDLKVGSNGLYEFIVELEGYPPSTSETHHPLYAHQGVNPIDAATTITARLHEWVDDLAVQYAHAGVERAAGRSAGLLVSDIWVDDEDRAVYEMPQDCTIRAALAYPPGVSLQTVADSVQRTVNTAIAETGVSSVAVRRGNHVAESAAAPTDTAAVKTAMDAIDAMTGDAPVSYYGHTASDIRYPMQYWDAPTVGFGPQAGAMGEPNEWIDRQEYLETISALTAFLVDYTPEN